MCIDSTESSNNQSQKSKAKGKEDDKRYEQLVTEERGILALMYEAKEAIITLIMYKKKTDNEIKQLAQNSKSSTMELSTPTSYHNVNLPQLSLPIFNGDPRQWREFWSGFNAAVHSQDIPQIQKMTYLMSCLKATVLQIIRGFYLAPENYEVVGEILTEKYGNSSKLS